MKSQTTAAISVRERPILFNSEMVRAILCGTKSQTRRIVKPQPSIESAGDAAWRDSKSDLWRNARQYARDCCPYGKPSDRLWVREGYCLSTDDEPTYRASIDESRWPNDILWRNSMFMPRRLSRITLEITGVRVERLQEIAEADARAEGAMFFDGRPIHHHGWRHDYHDVFPTARDSFAHLWDSINGKKAPWSSNPWLWVIEFRRKEDMRGGR